MKLRRTMLSAQLVLGSLACGGGDVIDGFATYGSTKLQGFVSRSDGSPVSGVDVFASFGPDAFGSQAKTDARGLYELTVDSYIPLDQAPFTEGTIACRLAVEQELADTTVTARFTPTDQTPIPMTVNFTVVAP